MPKKHDERRVFWTCDICFYTYDTRKQARECEKRRVDRYKVKGFTVGQAVVLHIHDRPPYLAFFVREEIREHTAYPVFQYAHNGEEYVANSMYLEQVDTIDSSIILAWAEKIKAHNNE